MSPSVPGPDAAYEIAANVADEIEVAGDRTPDPDLDLGHDFDPEPEPDQDQDQNGEPEPEPQSEPRSEPEPEPAPEQEKEQEQEPNPTHQPEHQPEHQPPLDLDLESELPEPAGSGNVQHEQPDQSHEPQGQTRQDRGDSHAEENSQGLVNGHVTIARAASASASAQHQDSEDHKGHGKSFGLFGLSCVRHSPRQSDPLSSRLVISLHCPRLARHPGVSLATGFILNVSSPRFHPFDPPGQDF